MFGQAPRLIEIESRHGDSLRVPDLRVCGELPILAEADAGVQTCLLSRDG